MISSYGRGMRILLSSLGAAAALSLLASAPARADEGMVIQGSVDDMVESGKTVGCQASFGVARRDMEYGGGAASLAVGSLAVVKVDGQPKVALKFGVVDLEAAETNMKAGGGLMAKAPVKVVLLEDGGDGKANNAADAIGVAPDEKGFGVYLFNAGPFTRQVLAQAGRNGRFKIAYAMADGGPLVRIGVDVTVVKRDPQFSENTVIDDKAAPTLAACLATVVGPTA